MKVADRAAIVTVERTAAGVELHATAQDGQCVTLRLDAEAGMTLADDITIACERSRPLRAAA